MHFLALGAGLFLLYGYVSGPGPDRVDRIIVDEAEVGRLAEGFQRTWMRPPTPQELRGLAEEFVKEEILCREALALGLDKDDLVVRRRMRQKLEFLNADLVEQRDPKDSELQDYLDVHPEQFRRPARYSFRQIYLDPDALGGDVEQRADDLLAQLQADPAIGADPQRHGDSTLLPSSMELASSGEISAVFGSLLAESIAGANEDAWSGPHRSSYGFHLIYLSRMEEGGVPELEEIRRAVEREWSNDRRRQADEGFYRALRERYSIEIRLPEDAARSDNLAASVR